MYRVLLRGYTLRLDCGCGACVSIGSQGGGWHTSGDMPHIRTAGSLRVLRSTVGSAGWTASPVPPLGDGALGFAHDMLMKIRAFCGRPTLTRIPGAVLSATRTRSRATWMGGSLW